MELRVGNKYRLGRKIGSGSFGDIFLGEHEPNHARALLLTLCRIAPQATLVFLQGVWHACTVQGSR
jgi:hypothetical protein